MIAGPMTCATAIHSETSNQIGLRAGQTRKPEANEAILNSEDGLN